LSMCGNFSDLKGVFLWTGGGKRTGGFEDGGPEHKGDEWNGMVEDGTFSG